MQVFFLNCTNFKRFLSQICDKSPGLTRSEGFCVFGAREVLLEPFPFGVLKENLACVFWSRKCPGSVGWNPDCVLGVPEKKNGARSTANGSRKERNCTSWTWRSVFSCHRGLDESKEVNDSGPELLAPSREIRDQKKGQKAQKSSGPDHTRTTQNRPPRTARSTCCRAGGCGRRPPRG